MDTRYKPRKYEEKIYQMWEKNGYFKPNVQTPRRGVSTRRGKPFTILLPLPNANDPLHMGHALFTIQDILIRFHRMKGDPALWVPGSDHAGIETQYVFEKKLAKQGKSRFDFDRKSLYQMISDYVEKNKNINLNQLKKLGFSLDWSRYHYSLEPQIIQTVCDTFRKLHQDGLIYRGERMVNFCPKCGTAFSDLEIRHVERDEFLYILDYGFLSIATTRPETIFADTAVAVNPKDRRYKKFIGRQAIIPLINRKIPIIADELVDMEFGTGALKITPAHDELDCEIGAKHKLPSLQVIDRSGRMINLPERYKGLKVKKAREIVIADLEDQGKLKKIKPHKHTVKICYRCGTTIEPMLLPQWFVKIKPLAKPAIDAVKKGKIRIFPKKRFEKMYFDWMENILDWNISRQIVWGPQIPVWYCLKCNPAIIVHYINVETGHAPSLISGTYETLVAKNARFSYETVMKGLQSIRVPLDATYSIDKIKTCPKCASTHILQETDTFDTWFLSGQWPFTTLLSGKNSKLPPERRAGETRNSKLIDKNKNSDFNRFYPTSVLDTLWDILFFWVARMIMLGLYRTGKVPFEIVHIHSRVVDKHGQKMSKSKNNVINPLDMVEKYGADALRMSLVFGIAPGSDIAVSDDKVRAMRNFANKIWNIGRFIEMQKVNLKTQNSNVKSITKNLKLEENKKIVKKLEKIVRKATENIEKFRFAQAAEDLYHFTWHEFADNYIEFAKIKLQIVNYLPAQAGELPEAKNSKELEEVIMILNHIFAVSLKLLHPFMPFVTEAIWQKMFKDQKPLIVSRWPV